MHNKVTNKVTSIQQSCRSTSSTPFPIHLSRVIPAPWALLRMHAVSALSPRGS